MNLKRQKLGYLLAMAGGLMWVSLGCAKPAGQPAQQAEKDEHADHEHDAHDHDHDGHDHDHDGHKHDEDDHAHADHKHDHSHWWCDEHGVPEEVCGLCNSKLAAEFQKKGDWCDEHDRPDSQCFICHPDLQAKFAAEYEAKYGKQPPKLKL